MCYLKVDQFRYYEVQKSILAWRVAGSRQSPTSWQNRIHCQNVLLDRLRPFNDIFILGNRRRR